MARKQMMVCAVCLMPGCGHHGLWEVSWPPPPRWSIDRWLWERERRRADAAFWAAAVRDGER